LTQQQGPLSRLVAVEQAIGAAKQPSISDTLNHREQWLRSTSKHLYDMGVMEASMVVTTLAEVQLSMGGDLSYLEDGRNWPYQQRVAAAWTLQTQVLECLTIASNRLSMRVEHFEKIAESAIRAGAEAKLLASPGTLPRQVWLQAMADRMSRHQNCVQQVTSLALALSEPELMSLFDRTFKRVFEI
jgi:hypothetical protein